MHPSQAGAFRKTCIVGLTILFAGALLVFTAQANIDLLRSVYPNASFVMFGLTALEGGVIYWTAYYLLHLNGIHKGIAVLALGVDAIVSGVGFLSDMEKVTHSDPVALPPVVVIIAGIILFNVAMAIISHLIPFAAGERVAIATPKELEQTAHYQIAETSKGPGIIANAGASILAAGQDIKALAQEKRKVKPQISTAPESSQPEDSDDIQYYVSKSEPDVVVETSNGASPKNVRKPR